MSKSIPDWSYSEEYYASLLAPCGLQIRTDPVKGKGLFAGRAIKEGDTVLKETALCCSQNLDDFNAGIPICSTCLRSVESPAAIITRLASKQLAAGLPESKPIKQVACRNAAKGCSTVYCSAQCEATGWNKFHSVLCTGIVSEAAKQAFQRFTHHGWVQGGIDLSDTHFLGLRFVAFVIARHRNESMAMEAAWAPVGQLIRAPMSKFTFTYLVVDEYETESKTVDPNETAAAKRTRRWQHFLKYKDQPDKDPIVKFSNKEAYTKPQMLAEGVGLLAAIFGLDEEEKQFLHKDRWSELLGAVLLNGQERSPNSPFFEAREQNKVAFAPYIKKLKAADKNPRDFDTSSRGQGIYPVGACFNHNCDPNIQVSYVDNNDETLLVVALRDIEAGEELCISYIDENAPVETRVQHLYEHYLFTCGCPKCSKDVAALGKAKSS